MCAHQYSLNCIVSANNTLQFTTFHYVLSLMQLDAVEEDTHSKTVTQITAVQGYNHREKGAVQVQPVVTRDTLTGESSLSSPDTLTGESSLSSPETRRAGESSLSSPGKAACRHQRHADRGKQSVVTRHADRGKQSVVTRDTQGRGKQPVVTGESSLSSPETR